MLYPAELPGHDLSCAPGGAAKTTRLYIFRGQAPEFKDLRSNWCSIIDRGAVACWQFGRLHPGAQRNMLAWYE